MMREVVGVSPGNAVEGHVILAVLEASHRQALGFHHPGPVGIHAEHAGCDIYNIRIIGARRSIFLDVMLVDDGLGLGSIQRTLGRCLVGRGILVDCHIPGIGCADHAQIGHVGGKSAIACAGYNREYDSGRDKFSEIATIETVGQVLPDIAFFAHA